MADLQRGAARVFAEKKRPTAEEVPLRLTGSPNCATVDPMAWPGGKDGAGVVQRLINEIPPHEVFVSAFLGDCAVMRRKRPAALNIGIDLDRANIERWRSGPPISASLELYCCDAVEWLRHRFGYYRVQGSGIFVKRVQGTDCGDARLSGPVLAAAEVAGKGGLAGVVARSSDAGSGGAGHGRGNRRRRDPESQQTATAAAVAQFGGVADQVTRAQPPFSAARTSDAGNGDARAPRVLAASAEAAENRGSDRDAQNGDGRSTTGSAAAPNGDVAGQVALCGGQGPGVCFVYCDPPYLMSTRRSKGRLYAHELSDERHIELLATLQKLPCLVMISHYPCELYDQALAGWRSFTFGAQTRGGARATEKVWCNYPPPAELHDPRYIGLNKRQRERVRRRVRNWTAGLARMHPLERQAVLDAIREGVSDLSDLASTLTTDP